MATKAKRAVESRRKKEQVDEKEMPAVKRKPEDYLESFLRSIKQLTVALSRMSPDDATIWRVKERVISACDLFPVTVLQDVGAYLYKFRKQIYDNDEKFFIDRAYDDELSKSEDSTKAESLKYLIPKIKEMWLKMNKIDRKELMSQVAKLLDDYLEYTCSVN